MSITLVPGNGIVPKDTGERATFGATTALGAGGLGTLAYLANEKAVGSMPPPEVLKTIAPRLAIGVGAAALTGAAYGVLNEQYEGVDSLSDFASRSIVPGMVAVPIGALALHSTDAVYSETARKIGQDGLGKTAKSMGEGIGRGMYHTGMALGTAAAFAYLGEQAYDNVKGADSWADVTKTAAGYGAGGGVAFQAAKWLNDPSGITKIKQGVEELGAARFLKLETGKTLRSAAVGVAALGAAAAVGYYFMSRDDKAEGPAGAPTHESGEVCD